VMDGIMVLMLIWNERGFWLEIRPLLLLMGLGTQALHAEFCYLLE